MLTPVGNPHTGGTGFEVVAPNSGKVYTLTNRHICRLAGNSGELAARHNANDEEIRLKIISVSSETDLCVLEAVPGGGASTPLWCLPVSFNPTRGIISLGIRIYVP